MIKLINVKTKQEVNIGDTVTDFRGDKGILTDVRPYDGMQGKVYVDGNQLYPTVIDCRFFDAETKQYHFNR